MKIQTRSFVARKPETIDITAFFKKFCIATRTIRKELAFAGAFLYEIASSARKGFSPMSTRFFCFMCRGIHKSLT